MRTPEGVADIARVAAELAARSGPDEAAFGGGDPQSGFANEQRRFYTMSLLKQLTPLLPLLEDGQSAVERAKLQAQQYLNTDQGRAEIAAYARMLSMQETEDPDRRAYQLAAQQAQQGLVSLRQYSDQIKIGDVLNGEVGTMWGVRFVQDGPEQDGFVRDMLRPDKAS